MSTVYSTSEDYRHFDTLDAAVESAKRSAAEDFSTVTVFAKTPVKTVTRPLPADVVVTDYVVTDVATGTTFVASTAVAVPA